MSKFAIFFFSNVGFRNLVSYYISDKTNIFHSDWGRNAWCFEKFCFQKSDIAIIKAKTRFFFVTIISLFAGLPNDSQLNICSHIFYILISEKISFFLHTLSLRFSVRLCWSKIWVYFIFCFYPSFFLINSFEQYLILLLLFIHS